MEIFSIKKIINIWIPIVMFTEKNFFGDVDVHVEKKKKSRDKSKSSSSSSVNLKEKRKKSDVK